MNRKLTAIVAMCATSLATIAVPANAAVTVLGSVTPDDASEATLSAMDAVCTAAAALHAAADPETNDVWTGVVQLGAVSWVSGPTEIGTHTFAGNGVPGTQVGAGTFTPAHTEILGDPYRNGGSVNMFGIQQAVGGHYSNSSYDFNNDFASTYAHAFSCDIDEQVYHAGYTIHHNAVGHYVNCDFGHGQGNDNDNTCVDGTQPQGSCEAHNNTGDSLPFWGQDTEQCKFFGTAAYDENVPPTLDPVTLVVNEPEAAINQDQTDTLLAHESFGEGFDTSETLLIGQVVVCISPSKSGTKLPGAWTKQNGYTGDKCTTVWYNGGATVGVPNLNDGSHNWVTVPIV
jgi:hypothetical protein